MNDKLVFGIRSCQVPPYPERAKECLDTWGKHAKDLGYTVKVLLGNRNLYNEYLDTQDILWSRAIDWDSKSRYKCELFEKNVFYPCKWFLNETDYEYFFITDDDSFIDIDKFIPHLKKLIEDYKEVDYMGCCGPWQGWNANIPHIEYISKPYIEGSPSIYAHGGPGFLLSRKAAKIIIDNFVVSDYETTYWCDGVTAEILLNNQIPLLHNGYIFSESPFLSTIVYTNGTFPPYIGDATGEHLIAQHCVSGKMEEINKYIKKR